LNADALELEHARKLSISYLTASYIKLEILKYNSRGSFIQMYHVTIHMFQFAVELQPSSGDLKGLRRFQAT
jgi:hypothetical protein